MRRCAICSHAEGDHAPRPTPAGTRPCMADIHDPEVHEPEALILCHCSDFRPASIGTVTCIPCEVTTDLGTDHDEGLRIMDRHFDQHAPCRS